MAMFSASFFSLRDLFRSVILGILAGWLLVSITDPTHKRFDFTITDAGPAERTRG